jgi:hypothetical protein
MEQVTGMGGLFFRVREHPGVAPVPSNYGELGWRQGAGPAAFAPFPEAYPNGRFARLYVPEGNPIELWGHDACDRS